MLLARKKTLFSFIWVIKKWNRVKTVFPNQNTFSSVHFQNRQYNNLSSTYFLSTIQNIYLSKSSNYNLRKMAKTKIDIKRECHPIKPPNILIYTNQEKFKEVKRNLQALLKAEQYVIYHLSDALLNSSPWIDNTKLLVIAHSDVSDEAASIIQNYIDKGGNVFGIATNFIERFATWEKSDCVSSHIAKCDSDDLIEVLEKLKFNTKCQKLKQCSDPVTVLAKDRSNCHPLIVKLKGRGFGTIVFSLVDLKNTSLEPEAESRDTTLTEMFRDILSIQFGLDCSSSPSPLLTPGYLLGNTEDVETLLKTLELKHNRFVSKDFTLTFTKPDVNKREVSETHLPIFTGTCLPEESFFRPEVYFSALKTRSTGRVVVYVDVISTTMTITEMLKNQPNVVVIAGRQTQGRGRGGNVWLSPRGCAMFSFPFHCSLSSHLGQRPSFLQHLVALAFVEAIRTKAGYEDLDIHLKWPNDVYFERRVKIGGVIITSTISQSQLICCIGMGINVSNPHPTASVWSAIEKLNQERNSALAVISTEDVIASTLTTFEQLVDRYQKEGPRSSIDNYIKRWLHSDSEVTLQEDRGRIVGVDEYGFLLVQKSGEVVSVQPDGNNFDLMHNLITTKQR